MTLVNFLTKGLSLTVVLAVLLQCSGDKGSAKKAQFVDSEVIGIHYKTSTFKQGVTDAKGRFSFNNNDMVTFYVGAIELPRGVPQVTPQGAYITPAHLAGTAEWEDDDTTLNIIRFLLSLDADGKPSNGIQIPSIGADLATEPLDFSVDGESFASSMERLLDDLSNELGRDFVMVNEEQAREHFSKTLETLNIEIDIQPIEEGELCTLANISNAEGAYSADLQVVLGEPTYEGEIAVVVAGLELRVDETQIEASECRFTQTENDVTSTDTWTWTEGETNYSLIQRSGLGEGNTFTISENEGADVSSGELIESIVE